MDYGHYTTRTVSETVALSNALANRDQQPSDEELRKMLVRFEITEERPPDREGLTHLAKKIRAIFVAEDEAEKVRILNNLLELYRPEPTIVDHDGEGYHLHYTRQAASLRGICSSMTMALTVLLCDYGANRLGVCPSCTDVFVDGTRNGRQRFCSRACANRVHVAEHRARQATAE